MRCANKEEAEIDVAKQQQQQQHDEQVGVATAFDCLLSSNCVSNAFIVYPMVMLMLHFGQFCFASKSGKEELLAVGFALRIYLESSKKWFY